MVTMESELILKKDVELHHTQDPYRVRKSEELDEDESIERELRFVLNRLTPQNFQKLILNLLNLPINSEERLRLAVDIIFQNAISEELYSHLYAQACKLMSQIQVPFEHVSTKFINFLTILLKKCEKEFDSDYHKDKYYEYLIKEAEILTDEEKRKEILTKANEQLERAKQNYIGNIAFLGEIYNMSLLDDAIIHEGIQRLFEKQEKDEENLECLCKLLTRIGHKFDNEKNKEKLNEYFDMLKNICDKRYSISLRIRFMILNLIELRENNWKPRHETGPKRIDDIRKEAQIEKEKKLLEFGPTLGETRIEYITVDGRRHTLFYGYAHHILDHLKFKENFDRILDYINKVDVERHNDLFEALISISMDRSDQDRDLLGEFFYENLKEKKLNLVQFTLGLRKILIKALESYVKSFKFPRKLSQILVNLFRVDFLDLGFLKESFEPIKHDQLCARVMAKTLRSAAERIGCHNVCDLFELSGLDFNYFFENFENEEDRIDFLREMKIDWVRIQHEHIKQNVELIEEFKEKLEAIFKETGSEPLAVIDRIEPEFHKEETRKEFIRALTVVFFENCMMNRKIDKEKFKKHEKILLNYIQEHNDLKLEVLYCVQVLAFHMKYKPNILKDSFQLLHDDNLIDKKVFYKWINNPVGKGHGMAQVFLNDFFESLSRPKSEE
ncbi:unnamed protein product [Brachionus calyciflorus]|uniref:Uncharacterized protein n=1 Tax=Brachionus calyciflorus TaxID=104777 RepID=A0A813UCJ2_9BILA|nr:unnamed protein product [Brachionus calyciflorus]